MTVGTALASSGFAVFLLLSVGTLLFGQEQLGTIVGVAGIFMSIFEVTRQRAPVGDVPETASGPGAPEPFRFPAEQGLAGGLFGGVIAALIITVVYYISMQAYVPWMTTHGLPVPTFWELFSPILVASALIGALVGLLGLGVAELFAHIASPTTALVFNRLTGAIVGGLAAGLITGPLGTLYFGLIRWPVMHPAQMLAGALPATGLLIFAILYFGKTRLDRVALRGLLIAFVATLMVGAVAAVVLAAFEAEIMALLQRYLVHATRQDLLVGGLYYGAFVGTLLGAVMGLTLVLAPTPTPAEPR
jgi:hypothetical protein